MGSFRRTSGLGRSLGAWRVVGLTGRGAVGRLLLERPRGGGAGLGRHSPTQRREEEGKKEVRIFFFFSFFFRILVFRIIFLVRPSAGPTEEPGEGWGGVLPVTRGSAESTASPPPLGEGSVL